MIGLLTAVSLLAISSALDGIVERAMAGRQGTAVVMDVASGQVIAAYRPDVAARRLAKPGSTVKPFALEALERAGHAMPGACARTLTLGDRRLGCSHPQTPGLLSPADALAYSCNSYFASMALRLSSQQLASAYRSAGLAAQGGSVETAGTPEERQLQALGEAAVHVTPLALLHAYRNLARRASPRVLEGLTGCTSYGTGRLAQPPGLEVAGKTGTATSSDRLYTHAWFAGFAPATSPRIAVVVFLERGHGGSDAAPVAGEVFKAWRELH